MKEQRELKIHCTFTQDGDDLRDIIQKCFRAFLYKEIQKRHANTDKQTYYKADSVIKKSNESRNKRYNNMVKVGTKNIMNGKSSPLEKRDKYIAYSPEYYSNLPVNSSFNKKEEVLPYDKEARDRYDRAVAIGAKGLMMGPMNNEQIKMAKTSNRNKAKFQRRLLNSRKILNTAYNNLDRTVLGKIYKKLFVPKDMRHTGSKPSVYMSTKPKKNKFNKKIRENNKA